MDGALVSHMFSCPTSLPDLYEFERREALSAKKTFTEYMKGDKSSSESEVETSSYGRKDERVKLYEAGIPEIVGRKTIEKIFEGEKKKK